jgi:hypothetical protein
MLAILAGIVSTALMTLTSEILALLLRKPYYVVRTLASMLDLKSPRKDPPPRKQYGWAIVIHYGIGVVFAYIYQWAIHSNKIDLDPVHSLLFGAGLGIVAIIGWRIFFAIHPDPPPYSFPLYLMIIWTGHVVLGIALFYLYRGTIPVQLADTIPLCLVQ